MALLGNIAVNVATGRHARWGALGCVQKGSVLGRRGPCSGLCGDVAVGLCSLHGSFLGSRLLYNAYPGGLACLPVTV